MEAVCILKILMLLSSRIRPLNTTEEKTGSKVIVKFPAGSSDDQCISIGVGFSLFGCFSFSFYLLYATVLGMYLKNFTKYKIPINATPREKCMSLTKC